MTACPLFRADGGYRIMAPTVRYFRTGFNTPIPTYNIDDVWIFCVYFD